MDYQFKCEVRALDLWQLSLSKIYRSVAGICNLVFTVALLSVTMKLWSNSNLGVRLLLLFLCNLFFILQPLAIYLRAKKQVKSLPKEMKIKLDDRGIHVMTKEESSFLKWKSVKNIKLENNMIILFTNKASGLMIPNRALGSKKDMIWEYIKSKKIAKG